MTQLQLKKLIERYTKARDELIEKILSTSGVGTKTYYNTVLKQVEKILAKLSKQSKTITAAAISAEYQKALNALYELFSNTGLVMLPPQAFAQLHTDAIDDLVQEAQYHTDSALAQVGRQVQRYLDRTKDEKLRTAGLEASAQKAATGTTIVDMKKALEKELKADGFMTVQYGEGEAAKQVPVEDYVMLVARSTTREAGNLARENQLTANNFDLVKMTKHYPTCKVCAMFQDRVYSISGKDKRFRPLSDAFSKGYHNVHPNCRHAIGPWIEQGYSKEEVEAESKKSLAPLADNRSAAEVALYNGMQRKNRQMRQDKAQYDRYKARLGDDAPKSFNAFRRMKKANSEKWNVLEKRYKDKGVIDKSAESGIIKTDKQFGKKVGKHASDFGLNANSPEDRAKMELIIDDIYQNRDEARMGKWAGQQSDVIFSLKGEDVVITKQNGEFVTILKGGIDSARVKDARRV